MLHALSKRPEDEGKRARKFRERERKGKDAMGHSDHSQLSGLMELTWHWAAHLHPQHVAFNPLHAHHAVVKMHYSSPTYGSIDVPNLCEPLFNGCFRYQGLMD